MVLANVLAEVVDSSAVSQAVKVSTPKHGAFSDNAGGDQNGVDSRVKFGVGGRKEELFKPTTTDRRCCALSPMSRQERVACRTCRADVTARVVQQPMRLMLRGGT